VHLTAGQSHRGCTRREGQPIISAISAHPCFDLGLGITHQQTAMTWAIERWLPLSGGARLPSTAVRIALHSVSAAQAWGPRMSCIVTVKFMNVETGARSLGKERRNSNPRRYSDSAVGIEGELLGGGKGVQMTREFIEPTPLASAPTERIERMERETVCRSVVVGRLESGACRLVGGACRRGSSYASTGAKVLAATSSDGKTIFVVAFLACSVVRKPPPKPGTSHRTNDTDFHR